MSLGNAFTGNVQVSLLADAGATPGATLASLGSLPYANVSTAQFQAYGFVPTSAFQLIANTRYWIEVTGSSPNAIQWSWSDDIAAPGVAGQYSYSREFDVNPNSAGFGPYQMAVVLPEPGSLALVCLGLVVAGLRHSRPRSQSWETVHERTVTNPS
jgi:hypothetical protein